MLKFEWVIKMIGKVLRRSHKKKTKMTNLLVVVTPEKEEEKFEELSL